jgi:hypothetical protein
MGKARTWQVEVCKDKNVVQMVDTPQWCLLFGLKYS